MSIALTKLLDDKEVYLRGQTLEVMDYLEVEQSSKGVKGLGFV